MTRPPRGGLFVLLWALWLGGAWASDRPFLAVSTAAAEEDDHQVWSLQTQARGDRIDRVHSIAIEYAADPLQSFQLELTRSRRRSDAQLDGAVEFEVKQLFNHLARDGWGWGVSLSLEASKVSGQPWRGGGWSAVLPMSLDLADGTALAHLDLGLARERGEARQRLLALGIEGEVARRTTLFAESVRRGDERLAHAGLRYWLKRERIALDLSWTQRRIDAVRASGWVMGLAWYDL